MFAYTHDAETGGLLLNDSTPITSKEPRPVYAPELDILGFDKHYVYEKQDAVPYMWAEANCYWYRGRMIARTKGGNLYTKPELELVVGDDGLPLLSEGNVLNTVDMQRMIDKNRELLTVLEQITLKKIFDVYKRNRKRVDCFQVAFSGGKDSIVLLDLIERAMPKSSFVVVFGDTGMEFPDTYDVVSNIERLCKLKEIEFYWAASHMKPDLSWKLFGPPSRLLRWCCYVHKSAPKVLKLRKIMNKHNVKVLDLVGVRANESIFRAEYDYEIDGVKQNGQRSFNPILEWNSAEIWMYQYRYNLTINPAYLKGNSRVGCVFCPMSAKSDYLKNITYADSIKQYADIVLEHYNEDDIVSGYWCARSNGTLLNVNEQKYAERVEAEHFIIHVLKPNSEWKEWIKTIADVPFEFNTTYESIGYTIRLNLKEVKRFSRDFAMFRTTLQKAAYCVGCRVCEANCLNACISFTNDRQVKINEENCEHCMACNKLDDGCLVCHSLKYPANVGGMKLKTTVDHFGTHAPKLEWLQDFFHRKNEFLIDNSLGPDQKTRFKRFLKEAGLIYQEKFSSFAEMLSLLGWDSESAQGLLLVNLAYNKQIEWYISNLNIGVSISREEVIEMLKLAGNSNVTSKMVASAFKRFC